MNYRQWKKNYKKLHGVNPPLDLDKRKQRRLAKKAVKHISRVDFAAVATIAAEAFTNAVATTMRELGRAFDAAGTACRNMADNVQPLKIKDNALSWEVKAVVCDYGVYENNALNGSSELKLITNSREAAQKIVEIMKEDQLEDYRLSYPELIQKE